MTSRSGRPGVAVSLVLTVGLLAGALGAAAQAPPRVARIGWLMTGSLDSPDTRFTLDAFRGALRERGWVEGQNVVIEYRQAGGRVERFPALAAELAGLNVDVILANNTPAGRALQRATTTIPIVVAVMGDPVADGLVASLARPGGNVTGATFLGPELVPKRLALLKEVIPSVSRVAALWHPGSFGERTGQEMVRQTETAARTLGIRLQVLAVRGPDDLPAAFAAMTRERAEALLIFPSAMLFNERRRIVDLTMRHRLPSVAMAREFVELGALMAYGASLPELFRRAAGYVDRILRGARPGELSVEQPTVFELSVNAKTARALGITIPPSLAVRADHLIE